jgi:Fe-S-cluster containining protein
MDDLPALPTVNAAPPCETEPCSQCCHDVEMILTERDVGRLALKVADTPELAEQQREIGPWHFEAEDGYLQLHVRPGPPAKGSPGGAPCWFLGDDGRCRVWQDRPEGCRLYPAAWDDGLRQAVLDEDYCPHTDGFELPQVMDDATRSLAERLEQEREARAS